MTNELNVWLGLPLAAILGWILARLLGPTADALGARLLDWLSSVVNRKGIADGEYLKFEEFIRTNHVTNGHRNFSERKTYLRDLQIASFLSSHSFFVRRAIKDAWIEASQIGSYNESDIFFAGMELLLNVLNKKDIQKLYEKYKNNGQASLWSFFELVEGQKPNLLSEEARRYLNQKRDEWEKTTE